MRGCRPPPPSPSLRFAVHPSLLDLRDFAPAALPPALSIPPLLRPFDATIRPPGSKSLTNRALLLAALAAGESTLHHALIDADDARVMIDALRRLGAAIDIDGAAVRVGGVGGRWRVPPDGLTLDLHNAGTATRFLAAAAVLNVPPSAPAPSPGPITIDGNARMRQRPIAELVLLLSALGVRAEYLGEPGYPPVRIHPPASLAALAPDLAVGRLASSQYVSALALVAPFLPRGLVVRLVDGGLTSASYFDMTLGLLLRLGAGVTHHAAAHAYAIAPGPLQPFDLNIEPDASGATALWSAAALTPGARLAVPGLDSSLQPDARYPDLLAEMGARRLGPGAVAAPRDGPLRPIVAPMGHMPDAALALAATCCFAQADSPPRGPVASTLTGLKTLRIKETDRIAALIAELSKTGATLTPGAEPFSTTVGHAAGGDEWLTIHPIGSSPTPPASTIEFATYDDHRMAMSTALVGLRSATLPGSPAVVVHDPACVAKTYPAFWADLRQLYG